MLQSMTGFGKSLTTINGVRYTIDIKTLNSKNIDLNIRLPQWLRAYELVMRKIISTTLRRGKVDIYINSEILEDAVIADLNIPVIQAYMEQMKMVSSEISIAERFNVAMSLPDVLQSSDNAFTDEDWEVFKQSLNEAIERVEKFRLDEGQSLTIEFETRVSNILNLLEKVPSYEVERITKLKERILKSLNELNNVDNDRFEQELIFYLEKLDITEEKVRLKNHCDYFLETMRSTESNGKKLNFITQEMGREINTLGSKSNHAELQKIVVQMKDELEKIKEQMLNVL